MTAAAQENAKALNGATLCQPDDVIDPTKRRGLIAATLAAAEARPPGANRFVDRW